MKLKMVKRLSSKRSENNRIRREGNIPAVVYSSGIANENISVDGVEFAEIVRNMIPGRLSTTKFKLVEGGKEVPAIIKEIQYHPTTYQIMHLDFERLTPGVSVTLNVPLEFSGVAECGGIKLGGFLRTVMRHAKVTCTPELIPDVFTIDVRELAIGQSKRLSNIQMPKGVKPLTSLEEVAVVIAKR
jgi:large subunit ribosomal protein L25